MIVRIGGIHRANSTLFVAVPSQVQVGRSRSFDRSGSRIPSLIYVDNCSSVSSAHMSWPALVCPGRDDEAPAVDDPDPRVSSSLVLHPAVRSKVTAISSFHQELVNGC